MKTPRKTLAGRLAIIPLFVLLLAPSAWMIATIPPLWRDADAYVQLTQDPRVATFWGHAPAYCYFAKIPLFLGEQWERMRGLPAAPRIVPFLPSLTDPGIWILIVTQHLALAIAALRFLTTVATLFWVRFALALVWASNALPYTFAHCVGSETLGLILVLVLATKGYRLACQRSEPSWTQWFGYALVLLLCISSREVNVLLIGLLPLAFLFLWLLEKLRFGKRQNLPHPSPLRHGIIAIALGLACAFVSDSLENDLARKTKFHPHSRMGFTFLWRLHFLNDLSPESRAALLQKVKARAPTDQVRYLVALLEQLYAESPDIGNPTTFMKRAIDYFGGSHHWEDLDRALNQTVVVFLWPPPPELVDAIRNDFLLGMTRPSPAISEYLFNTTTYYFGNKEELPECGRLVTFRGMSPDKIMQFALHPYFHLWQRIPYLVAVGVWAAALLLLAVFARVQRKDASAPIAYATSLLLAGLAQFVTSCVLHDYEPRFSLPLWLFLLCSFFVLVAGPAHSALKNGESAGGCRSEP